MIDLCQKKQSFLKSYFGDLPFECTSLVGDASSRLYETITLPHSTFVLCTREPFSAPADPQLSVFSYLRSNGIATPRLLAYDGAAGFLLQENLGSTHLEDLWRESSAGSFVNRSVGEASTRRYEEALSLLLQMQRGKSSPEKCFAWTYYFDVEKLAWELGYGRLHVFETHAQISFSPPELTELRAEFVAIASYLVVQPRVFTHRDYHSRNLMLDRRTNQLAVIDYQDARLGPATYDIVSLVYDSYVHLMESARAHLLDEFFMEQKDLFNGSREKFALDLAHQKVQRCFKACGSFASLFYLKHKDRYLQYLPGTLQTVLSALDDLEQIQTARFPILRRSLLRAIAIGAERTL